MAAVPDTANASRTCQIIPTRPLLHQVTSPAIAVRPEWALGTHLSFGVVDPFLMRAAYLHRLWISGEVYEPLRHGAPTAEAA